MVSGGECVRAKLQPGQSQAWELNKCESMLPFMCRTEACTRGSVHCSNGKCVNKVYMCNSVFVYCSESICLSIANLCVSVYYVANPPSITQLLTCVSVCLSVSLLQICHTVASICLSFCLSHCCKSIHPSFANVCPSVCLSLLCRRTCVTARTTVETCRTSWTVPTTATPI